LGGLLLIADANQRNETIRLEALFTLMDFNNANQISPDELTILFMCIANAITAILQTVQDMPSAPSEQDTSSCMIETRRRNKTGGTPNNFSVSFTFSFCVLTRSGLPSKASSTHSMNFDGIQLGLPSTATW